MNLETCFEASGTDITSGIRVCDEEPRTIMESGSDAGNFHGAAIYLDGTDLVITSELSAGSCRYVTERKLHDDGTSRHSSASPRSATRAHAITNPPRLLAVRPSRGRPGRRVEEHNDPATLLTSDTWRTLQYEDSRDRDPDRRRYWRLTNRTTGRGFELEPGWGDAYADLYGAGDTWFLRYHPAEIHGGQGFTTRWALSRARIDLFADREEIDGHDVGTWYAGPWNHEHGDDGDWVGPHLRRIEP